MKKFYFFKFIVVLLTSFLFVPSVFSQSGSNDNTFNSSDIGFGYGDGANGTIYATALQNDGKIIIGGSFTAYNATTRNKIARLNADGTLDETFNPGRGAVLASEAQQPIHQPFPRTAIVHTIVIQVDGKIIISGDFDLYNGITRNAIARLNADGTLDGSFNPGTGANSIIRTTAIQPDGKVIIGGFFANNGIESNYIARLNTDGTQDASFNPGTGANNTIHSTALQSDGKIIIGGFFSTYNGTERNYIARLNTDGTLDETFNQGRRENSFIQTIAIQNDGKILIGGYFNSYNGTARNFIARLKTDGTLDSTFNPGTGANFPIVAITIQSAGKIIIGGEFRSYNGTSRNYIARLNADGSLDETFNPGTGANSLVRAITIQPNGKIIMGGSFTFDNSNAVTTSNGPRRNRIARLNIDGTMDELFNPGTGANSEILATIIQNDGKILISGFFTSYNGKTNGSIVRLSSDGTIDETFNTGGSGANSTVEAITVQSDGKIIIGGRFTYFNGTERNNIARLNVNGTLDESFNPGTGTYSSAGVVVQTDGKIIIYGGFNTYNGTFVNRIARLQTDGTLDQNFSQGSGANGNVNNVIIQSDGKIIIAGEFSSYNGTGRRRIARLNADGTLDETFNPGTGANSIIYTSAIQSDGKIIIGGLFTTYNGTPRNRIARLNANGTLDETFNPGTVNGFFVLTTSIQSDGKIIIGGDFTAYNGMARNNIARLNADGMLDESFNPGTGASARVRTTPIQSDGKIIIGGGFTSYNGTGRNRIARILTSGSTLPVEFITINAQSKPNGVEVSWRIPSENDMKAYHVERSSNGRSFEQAGSVASIGNSAAATSYSFTDTRPLSGTSFYRIKAISRSGESKYSPVAKVNTGKAQPMLSIYPNPVRDQLNILISNAGTGSYNVKITTASGALVAIKSKLQLTDNIIRINTSAFASGMYIVEVTNDKGDKLVEKFTK